MILNGMAHMRLFATMTFGVQIFWSNQIPVWKLMKTLSTALAKIMSS